MNANELMVGDWVMQICVGEQRFNHPIKIGLRELIRVQAALSNSDDRLDVRPIPLTPEILEKNGFTDWADHSRTIRSCSLLVDKTNIIVQKIDGNDYIFTQIYRGGADSCEFRMDLKYVHELQHALKLCHIEKTIEL